MNIYALLEREKGVLRRQSLETLSYAHSLRGSLSLEGEIIGILFGKADAKEQETLLLHGAESLVCIGDASSVSAQTECAALGEMLAEMAGDFFFLTMHGFRKDELMARLSVRCRGVAVSRVSSLCTRDGGDSYRIKRRIYTNKATEERKVSGGRYFFSLSRNTVSLDERDGDRVLSVRFMDCREVERKARVLDIAPQNETVSLQDADVVVSGGRGMQGPEHWHVLESLAKQLGAAMACSKPVSDMEWRPHHEHVGQTGIKISPKLYIAAGISGAIQHLAGVSGSRVIVVINEDKEAPFFQSADYGVLGDAMKWVPALTQALKNTSSS